MKNIKFVVTYFNKTVKKIFWQSYLFLAVVIWQGWGLFLQKSKKIFQLLLTK